MHLYGNGMPLPLVSEWFGHAQMNTTKDFYANANIEMKRKAIDLATTKLSSLLADDYNYDFQNDEELVKNCMN